MMFTDITRKTGYYSVNNVEKRNKRCYNASNLYVQEDKNMDKFCSNCGAVVPEDSAFCPACGTVSEQTENTNGLKDKLVNNKKNIIIVVAAVLVVVLCVVLFGGNSPKKIAQTYLKAHYKTANGNAIAKVLPKDYIKYVMDEEDVSKKEIVEALDEQCEDAIDWMEDAYDDCKISWKIKDVEDAKKAETKDIKEYYDDEYDIKVKKVKVVEAEVTVKYDDDGDKEEEDFDVDIYVVKIGGKWCLDADYAYLYDIG